MALTEIAISIFIYQASLMEYSQSVVSSFIVDTQFWLRHCILIAFRISEGQHNYLLTG